MQVEEVRTLLESLADETYGTFQSRLMPGTDNVLGVRIPELRKLARRMVKGDWKSYFDEAPNKYYEEDMLRGFLIGYADMALDERLEYLKRFLPSIHNWAVCDCVCATLKFTKQHKADVWEYICPLFASKRPYDIRFASVMALDYYAELEYAPKIFEFFDQVKNTDYYVQMGIAWAISVFYVHLPEMTESYLQRDRLDDFTHNKSIQKICESYRVDKETKVKLRKLKRKS